MYHQIESRRFFFEIFSWRLLHSSLQKQAFIPDAPAQRLLPISPRCRLPMDNTFDECASSINRKALRLKIANAQAPTLQPSSWAARSTDENKGNGNKLIPARLSFNSPKPAVHEVPDGDIISEYSFRHQPSNMNTSGLDARQLLSPSRHGIEAQSAPTSITTLSLSSRKNSGQQALIRTGKMKWCISRCWRGQCTNISREQRATLPRWRRYYVAVYAALKHAMAQSSHAICAWAGLPRACLLSLYPREQPILLEDEITAFTCRRWLLSSMTMARWRAIE